MDHPAPSTPVSDFLDAAHARGPLDDARRRSLADEAESLAQGLDFSSGSPRQGVTLHAFAASLLIDISGGRTDEELQRILGHLDKAGTLAAPFENADITGMLARLRGSAYARCATHLDEGRLDDAAQACLAALALPEVAASAEQAGPMAFNAGRFLVRRNMGQAVDAATFDQIVRLFTLAYHSYQLLDLEAAAADAARYLVQLGAWHMQTDGDEAPSPGQEGPADADSASTASLRPTSQFEHLLGSSWVLLNEQPVELSPAEDPPPFPSQMISINAMPPGLDTQQAIASLENMLAPLVWSGTVRSRVAGHHHGSCAVVEMTGNPLTGDMLFVARPFQLAEATVLLIYETTDPRRIERCDATVEAIEGLTWPLLGRPPDRAGAGQGLVTGEPLSHLAEALAGSPVEAGFVQALAEPNLVERYLQLSVVAAHLFRSPDLVDVLGVPAHRDLVRMLEGISSTLTRLGIEPIQMYTVSLLVRGLLLHPEASHAAIERALRLSGLLMARTLGQHPSRWEEAMLSQLLGRAAWAARTGSEDYGDLGAIAESLTRDQPAAKRILMRLVDDSSFAAARDLDEYSHFRLARCDIALALMQRMLPADPARSLTPDDDDDDEGSGQDALPPEFSIAEPEPSDTTEPVSFFRPYLLTLSAAFQEMRRLYGVDIERNRNATLAYLEGIWPEDRGPSLLFLRGFRSARRVWIENTFTFRSRCVIPYPEEPAHLSMEAALVKGLGLFGQMVALGGLQDPMGMGRVGTAFDDKTWRTGFEIQSEKADVIVVLPDETDALTWELNQLVDRSLLDKALLVMVPIALDEKAGPVWRHTVDTFARRGVHLPAFDGAGGFLMLDADGAPVERFEFASLADGRLADRLEERLGVQAQAG